MNNFLVSKILSKLVNIVTNYFLSLNFVILLVYYLSRENRNTW